MSGLSERVARMALAAVVEAGDPAVVASLGLGGPVELWEGIVAQRHRSAWARRASELDLEALVARTEAIGARFVIPGDAEWPSSLDVLGVIDPKHGRGGVPLGLWLKGPGDLSATPERAVALVGSRNASGYGIAVAGDLAVDLAARGWGVLSGGAFGVDAAAHRGALAGEGSTIAVLACGLDVGYPRAHHRLFDDIAARGLLVSEHAPGEHPTRVRFLGRNRLIAALSAGVVVVEAAARSGARNTATWATACQRPVGAVPGPVTSATSAGTHAMIREHAAELIANADDVVSLVGRLDATRPDDVPHERRESDDWAPTTLTVFEALPGSRGSDVGTIARRAGVSVGDCLAELGELEAAGFAVRTPRGWAMARKPAVSG